MINKAKIVGIIILFIFIGLSLFYQLSERAKSNSISNKINLELFFKGVVVSKKNLYGDVCFVKLKLSESSYEIFDPRDTVEAYLVVIKDSLAELVVRCHSTEINYEIIYEGNMNKITVLKEGVFIDSYEPYVSNHMNKYDIIRKLHDL